MRILLINNFAPDRQESMLRFNRMLEDGLRARRHDVDTWAPEPATIRWLPRYKYDGPAKYFGYVDKFVIFPRRVKKRLAALDAAGRAYDAIHITDHANAVYAPLFSGRPLLTTCHDLLQIRSALGEFPQHRIPRMGSRYQRWILRHLKALPRAACVSTQTKADLQRLAGLKPAQLTVIPNGLNYPYRTMVREEARSLVAQALRERGLPADLLVGDKRGFLLNIGGGQWYKNRRGLLEIYAALQKRLQPAPRLVMVGKPLSPELVAYADQLGVSADRIHLSNVPEEQLRALYSISEALLFPSWQEGFGWPIAEAQACGCPVFTSNRAPMTEVGGEGAGYFDPMDPLGAAEQIAALWPRRRELAARGLSTADQWSPAVMIGRYVEHYATLSRQPREQVVA